MDRNTVIGFILLGVLFIAFFSYQNKIALEQQQVRKQIADSLAFVDEQRLMDSLQKAESDRILREKTLQEISAKEGAPVLPNVSQDSLDRIIAGIEEQQYLQKFGPFTKSAQGEEKFYRIENNQISITLSNRGGKVHKVVLKEFKNSNKDSLVQVVGDRNELSYSFFYDQDKFINTDSLYMEAEYDPAERSVVFSLKATEGSGQGAKLKQVYRLPEEGYVMDYDLELEGFNEIIPAQQPYLILNWRADMLPHEKSIDYERQQSKVYYSYSDKGVENKGDGEVNIDTKLRWVSYVQQFFNMTLIAPEFFDNSGSIKISAEDTTIIKHCESELYISYNNQSGFTFPMQLCYAPNQFNSLKKMDIGLEQIIPLGWGIFGWVNRLAIIPLFNFLNNFISNYGLIILIMTIIIKLVLSPFTYKSYLSMAKMKALKPELDELKEKFGEDQAKMSSEQMKLYKKTGVSPLGGCLPMLFQFPILIAMYRFFPASIELRQESFLWADDLSTYDAIITWSGNIPLVSWALGNHLSLFTVLMTISSILYARMNSQMSSASMGGMAAQMKSMQYIFPFMLLFIFNKFPAALTYYYFLSNILTYAQQWSINRFLIDEDALHKQIQENKKKPVKKSRFQKKLEEIQKQQQSQKKDANKKPRPKK